MHEIEDLVEWSVRVLPARYPAADRRVRDWFGELYAFQDGYDCAFTHFRVMEILLAREYSFRFGIEEHPDYRRRREFFDGLTCFTALADIDPEQGGAPDFGEWRTAGYVDPPHLYCDAGTALWRRSADLGMIRGTGAEPLRGSALVDVVREVTLAAAAEGEIELIAMWHALGPGARGVVDGYRHARLNFGPAAPPPFRRRLEVGASGVRKLFGDNGFAFRYPGSGRYRRGDTDSGREG